MDLDKVSLGNNIKKYRTIAKLTQGQLAEIIGCSDRHIGHIEKGQNAPSVDTLVSIANALNVGIDRLIYDNLDNRTDYFIQELNDIWENFEGANKQIVIDMARELTELLKKHKF